MSRQVIARVVCLAVVFAAGMVGVPFTAKATKTWHAEIPKPSWTPPGGPRGR